MPPQRPYSQLKSPDLRALFEHATAAQDVKVLKALRYELANFRTKPGAKELLKEVDAQIATWKAEPTPPSLHQQARVSPRPAPKPSVSPATRPLPLFPDLSPPTASLAFVAGEADIRAAPEPSSSTAPFIPPTEPAQETGSDEELEPIKPVAAVERTLGVIRKPGRFAGVPDKWEPELSKELKPDWAATDPPAKRFELALRALIKEMRKNQRSGTQIMLKGGRRTGFDTDENVFEFSFDGDEALFEGASISAIADGVQSRGRIVALQPSRLVLALEQISAPHISLCVVYVDNTAMLEALADRLKAVHTGENKSFNSALANDVLTNSNEEVQPDYSSLSGLPGDPINPLQLEAVAAALANSVSYLWGPPGTGKTQTLAELGRRLLANNKRLLICSNTNQAVDQVLAKLCKTLETAAGGDGIPPTATSVICSQDLHDGKVVRIGKIDPEGDLNAWASFVSIDGIVERKSADLKAKLAELEDSEARIERRLEPYRETIGLFRELDQAIEVEVASRKAAAEVSERIAENGNAMVAANKQFTEYTGELESAINAGAIGKIFKRTPETISADLNNARVAAQKLKDELIALRNSEQSAKAECERAEVLLNLRRTAVHGLDQFEALGAVDAGETEMAPIRQEMAVIRKALSDVAAAVITDARIVGATTTKVFLSAQSFAEFDAVMVDEASMVLLPALYFVAGGAKEKVIVSGDFRQLPPIVQTNERALIREIGGDIFQSAGITEHFDKNGLSGLKRTKMLREQYRMDDAICKLVSRPMYVGNLVTGAGRISGKVRAPAPFNSPLTIVDTSIVGPFAAKDAAGSKYNLMSALTVRNLCRHLAGETGYVSGSMGIIAPYAAQRRLLQKLLQSSSLDDVATAGTVHRFQGDEKDIVILDLTDGLGLKTAGLWFQSDRPDEAGARLLNVAITRAKNHLMVVGDLSWLDKKLPARSLLRRWLFEIQDQGSVIDARDVIKLWPVEEALHQFGVPISLDPDTTETGLFHEKDFDVVVANDIANAKTGVAIWSAFLTPQRVAQYGDLFRSKIQAGVKVRCVVRPPWDNGSMREEIGAEALQALEQIGCIVDTRRGMHQKAVIIDDEVVWFGSLNALSHTGNTGEMMARVEGRAIALQIASFLSIDRGGATSRDDKAAGLAYTRENPRCGCGAHWSCYSDGRHGPYWRCLDKDGDWTLSVRNQRNPRPKQTLSGDPPPCPKCGKSTKARHGRFGEFWGCTDYPNCDGLVRASA